MVGAVAIRGAAAAATWGWPPGAPATAAAAAATATTTIVTAAGAAFDLLVAQFVAVEAPDGAASIAAFGPVAASREETLRFFLSARLCLNSFLNATPRGALEESTWAGPPVTVEITAATPAGSSSGSSRAASSERISRAVATMATADASERA